MIFVDGKQAASIEVPSSNALSGPLGVDLSKFVSPGKHHIQVHRSDGSSRASIQVFADYYVPWTHTAVGGDLHQEANTSDALRLIVNFNKQSAHVGETVQCNVDAERSASAATACCWPKLGYLQVRKLTGARSRRR